MFGVFIIEAILHVAILVVWIFKVLVDAARPSLIRGAEAIAGETGSGRADDAVEAFLKPIFWGSVITLLSAWFLADLASSTDALSSVDLYVGGSAVLFGLTLIARGVWKGAFPFGYRAGLSPAAKTMIPAILIAVPLSLGLLLYMVGALG